MKTIASLFVLAGSVAITTAAEEVIYTNFIRQFQTPTNVVWDAAASVESQGSQPSDLAINPGGARFELWTVSNTPLASYLLSTAYVGTYVPVATVTIRSEDPYPTIPRTRADRPFYVDYTVSGLLSGASDPAASKSVKLLRHVQSYGAGGTGININRSQATLLSQATISTNGDQTLTYALTSVPGADRSKVRGEERFSIFSQLDSRTSPEGITYVVPETEISSKFIQIWPVADASISGIAQNQIFRFAMPQLTLTLNDLYPSSSTYAQVYKGDPALGTEGTVVPGSSLVIDDSLPQNSILVLDDYDSVINSDGRWTMEILTATPFGIDRLAYVSFNVDRTIELNGTFTTIE
jgi:hypothetical protein